MKDFGINNAINEEGPINSMPTSAAVTTSSYPKDAFVTNCHLVNIRARTDKKSEVLMTISKGCKVSITGDKANGFYPVRYNGKTGFIMAEFLEVK